MDDINDYVVHFSINSFVVGIFQIMVIASSIILIVKRPKSIGAKITLAGCILTLISIISYSFLPFLTSHEDNITIMKSQVIQAYFNTFSFLVFTIGFLLFAVNDLKKEHYESRT